MNVVADLAAKVRAERTPADPANPFLAAEALWGEMVETVWNAIVDPAFTRQYFFGSSFEAPPVAGREYRSVLADGSVDAVHLTTPNRYHYEQARAVLRAGKHVLCEKPLAMTSRETAELVQNRVGLWLSEQFS